MDYARASSRASRTGARVGRASVLLPIAAAILAPACESQEEYRLSVGRRVYERKCSECHGREGEGPRFVESFGGTAPDLRMLSREYGSPLARDVLARFIDGRGDVAAHGPRAMPVWGEELYDNLPENTTVEAIRAGTIELLLDYLETIQIRDDPGER
jgi:mono/diheme cytochrome c family protein